MHRRRVLCVINSLAGGGAERMFASLLEAFAVRAPHLAFEAVLLDDEPSAYALPASMPIVQLGVGKSMSGSVAALAAHTRKRRPDLLFSFLTRANCASVIAGALCGRPAVISERTFTTAHLAGRAMQKSMVRALYPAARHVITLGEASRTDLVQNFGVASKRVSVIHNPIAVSAIQAQAVAPAPAHPRPYIVAMGRLAPSKNFVLLVEAFARAARGQDLLILGEGPERNTLQHEIDVRGLRNRVHLMGRLDNPFPILAGAQCLAVSSNVEGFPNVIGEALALGVPVLSTDCDCGPAELLGGNPERKAQALSWARYGALVPVNDVAAFAAGLTGMRDPAKRALYAERGPARAATFDPDRAGAAYLAVIERALSAPGRATQALEPAA